jgi:hypothetical protein
LDISVEIVTRIRAGRQGTMVRFPERENYFSLLQRVKTNSGFQGVRRAISHGDKAAKGVKLMTAIPPLLDFFMAWCLIN